MFLLQTWHMNPIAVVKLVGLSNLHGLRHLSLFLLTYRLFVVLVLLVPFTQFYIMRGLTNVVVQGYKYNTKLIIYQE